MNKNTVAKLCLFASGLTSRMQENKAYFNNIKITYKSGTKEFIGTVSVINDRFVLSYQGAKTEIEPADLVSFLKKKSSDYDSVSVIYSERGAKLIINASDENVKFNQTDNTDEEPLPSEQILDREYFVNPLKAKDLLTEIGILAKNGKIKNDKIRKYNQIDYFIELTAKDFEEIDSGKEIVIMDCACGKSYLSFALNYYLRDVLKRQCRFICIDYSETVIKASQKIADNLNYKNMEFVQADLRTYIPNTKIDAVISLHACDAATDMALSMGIRTNAKLIVAVPCCHKDMLSNYEYKPFDSIIKHGIIKARMAELLTDGLRSLYLESKGYKVSVKEYISPLETPKNIMLKAYYTGKNSVGSKHEYERLKTEFKVIPAIERMR